MIAALAAGSFFWLRARDARVRWVRDEAVPQIGHLATAGDPVAAYRLAQRALAIAPDDTQLAAAWSGATHEVSVGSDPEGAEVAIRALSGKDEGWAVLGKTPIVARLPFGQMRWRFARDGYEPREIIPNPVPERLHLSKAGTAATGMVEAPAGEVELPTKHSSIRLPGFWIDATEVTNRQFKAFVEAGGYQKRDTWTQPFVRGRPDAIVGRGDGAVPGRQPAGPGPRRGSWARIPEGAGRPARRRGELVRGGSLRGVRGQDAANVYHWQQRGRRVRHLLRCPSVEQLRRPRPAPVGASGVSALRHARHGRQRQGMGVEREQRGRRFVLGGAWFEAAPHSFTTRTPARRSRVSPASASGACARTRRSRPRRRPSSPSSGSGDVDSGERRRLHGVHAAVRLRQAPARRPCGGARGHPAGLGHRARVVRGAYGEERLPAIVMLPRHTGLHTKSSSIFRVGRDPRQFQPERLHAVGAVPGAQRPCRGPADLSADLRAPAPPPVPIFSARSASNVARTSGGRWIIWNRGPTSTGRGSPSTA